MVKKSKNQFSVGVDIEDIARFEKMAKNKTGLKTIYTPSEIKYCFTKKKKPAQHLAARFVGKEAVIKALAGLGFTTFYRQIEIKNKKSGVPEVTVLDKKIKGKVKISLSLSHSKDKAIGFAMAFLNS